MSTRAQVRFATREVGVSFNEHPEKINAQFYVHHDGYPEGLGLDIAHSIKNNSGNSVITNWEIEHIQDIHTDLDYIYYIWSDYDKSTWISIFMDNRGDTCSCCGGKEDLEELCIFVGEPKQLIEKYKLNTNEDG